MSDKNVEGKFQSLKPKQVMSFVDDDDDDDTLQLNSPAKKVGKCASKYCFCFTSLLNVERVIEDTGAI